MSPSVCLAADTLGYAAGGGHRWAYLNWALGLRAAGCEVLWGEPVASGTTQAELHGAVPALRADLERYGLGDSLVLYDAEQGEISELSSRGWPAQVDLVLTLSYGGSAPLLELARHSALIDIDPGLTQLWIQRGYVQVPHHDMYFSIGEAARRNGLPDCGIEWHYTPPCVDLIAWPRTDAPETAPFTTVSHWWSDPDEGWIELDGEWTENSKRAGFEPVIDLPSRAGTALELALGGLDSPEEAARLRSHGWALQDAWSVAGTTRGYADYLRGSRGEFSCAKPSVTRLAPGWVSDRTVCYLASGRPAVVQYAGQLELPDGPQGLLQFRSPDEAVAALGQVQADYERHSAAARALAEARFDACQVATRLLEQVLP